MVHSFSERGIRRPLGRGLSGSSLGTRSALSTADNQSTLPLYGGLRELNVHLAAALLLAVLTELDLIGLLRQRCQNGIARRAGFSALL